MVTVVAASIISASASHGVVFALGLILGVGTGCGRACAGPGEFGMSVLSVGSVP